MVIWLSEYLKFEVLQRLTSWAVNVTEKPS